MNQKNIADSCLLSASSSCISKHISIFQIIIASLIALAGVVAIVVSLDIDDSSSILNMALLTVGTICILIALYRFFWKCKENIYIPTGSVVIGDSYYFDICEMNRLIDILEKGNFENRVGIMMKMSGNLRLDCMKSKDCSFVAVQLFHFVPYTYEPSSRVYSFTGKQALELITCLTRKGF